MGKAIILNAIRTNLERQAFYLPHRMKSNYVYESILRLERLAILEDELWDRISDGKAFPVPFKFNELPSELLQIYNDALKHAAGSKGKTKQILLELEQQMNVHFEHSDSEGSPLDFEKKSIILRNRDKILRICKLHTPIERLNNPKEPRKIRFLSELSKEISKYHRSTNTLNGFKKATVVIRDEKKAKKLLTRLKIIHKSLLTSREAMIELHDIFSTIKMDVKSISGSDSQYLLDRKSMVLQFLGESGYGSPGVGFTEWLDQSIQNIEMLKYMILDFDKNRKLFPVGSPLDELLQDYFRNVAILFERYHLITTYSDRAELFFAGCLSAAPKERPDKAKENIGKYFLRFMHRASEALRDKKPETVEEQKKEQERIRKQQERFKAPQYKKKFKDLPDSEKQILSEKYFKAREIIWPKQLFNGDTDPMAIFEYASKNVDYLKALKLFAEVAQYKGWEKGVEEFREK